MYALYVPDELVHREHFPPEMVVYIYADTCVIDILYAEDTTDKQRGDDHIETPHWGLHYQGTEPITIFLDSHPSHADWAEKNHRLSDLLFEAATPFCHLLETCTGPDMPRPDGDDPVVYVVRFREGADFYRLLFRLMRKVTSMTNAPVPDYKKFIAEWITFWHAREGDGDVARQLAWYAAHGPDTTKGETQAHYDADRAEFESLIAENLAVLNQLKTEAPPR